MQVFTSVEDTQIPALRRYVHLVTSVRRKQHLERLMRSLERFVFGIKSYITESNHKVSSTEAYIMTIELVSFSTIYLLSISHIQQFYRGRHSKYLSKHIEDLYK